MTANYKSCANFLEKNFSTYNISITLYTLCLFAREIASLVIPNVSTSPETRRDETRRSVLLCRSKFI